MSDNINPDHYRKDPSGVECIQITRHRNFAIGSALKYLWRAGLKTEQGKTATEKQVEDLEKAIWFIRDEIQRLKNGAGEKVFGGTLHPTGNPNSEAHGPELPVPAAEGKTIQKIQYQAFQASKAKGFWDDADRHNDDGQAFLAFIAQKLALIHSEVTEALDEVRDNRPDWIIRHAEDGKPEGIASELADVVIRALDLAEWLEIDLGQVIEEKMAYNTTRPAKHGKNF